MSNHSALLAHIDALKLESTPASELQMHIWNVTGPSSQVTLATQDQLRLLLLENPDPTLVADRMKFSSRDDKQHWIAAYRLIIARYADLQRHLKHRMHQPGGDGTAQTWKSMNSARIHSLNRLRRVVRRVDIDALPREDHAAGKAG